MQTPLQGSVQSSVQSSCEMGQGTSPSSASEMECTSKTCNMKCAKDNCKMKCGVGNSAWCYAKCEGRGCTIDCNSEHCEISLCSKGYCTVNVGQGSDVSITSCAGGCCTLNCHESIPKNLCVIQPNACPNNTCIVNFGSTPTQLPSVCSASPKPATSAPATTPSAASGREYAKLVTFGGMIGGLLITALLLV